MGAAERVYYIDEGQHLRAIHAVRLPNGKYRPTGIEERVSFPLIQATIARAEGRPDLHPTELGFNELGAGKLKAKIKTVAKKVAKSKVLKKVVKVAKIAGPIVAAVVPGGQVFAGAALAVKVGTTAAKAGKKIKASKTAAKAVASAVKSPPKKAPPAAVARAAATIRAKVAPTSEVAPTTEAALLREQRIEEASQVLATLPPEDQEQATAKIEARLDAYKVVTPRGNVVWVGKDQIA